MARRLEFDGVYVAEQPEDDDIKAHWDKLVISAKYDLMLVVAFYEDSVENSLMLLGSRIDSSLPCILEKI